MHISKDKLDKSNLALPDHEKLLRYRAVRTAAIVAEMKRRGVEVTEMNAVHLAAILCAAVPTDPAFLLPYHVAFVLEESIESGAVALPMDSSTEPAAEPCGGMWVGDPKAWPEWKTVHPQTALVKAVADQAEAAFGDHPLYSGDDFGDAEHHFNAICAWMSERPNALFTPPELVVDAMMLTEGRNREEIVRCSSGRRLSSVPSVRKFASADKPGMRGYLHTMGQMSGVVTSLHDAFDWDRRQVLRISPKNPASTTDVEIGPDDGWAFFDLAINFRGQTDTEKVLIHGTSQSSLWSILGGMQVTASTASEEWVGVWTSLKAVEALGYSTLSHYGQNTWARVAVCITQPDESENLFSDNPHLKGVKRGAQRVFPNARLGICGICIKLEKPAADSQYVELCNSGGDSTLQYYNPFVEWNPHAPSVVWAMHKFFPENYMGPIGLSVEEENLRAAPGTPQAAEAEGGALFARIVPKSNMFEAIRGETFELTLSKGYLTEIKDEAKAIGRGALVPRELECFDQARKVMRLIRSGKVVPSTVELPRGGYSRVAVDAAQLERQWDAWAAAMLADVMLSIYPSIVLHEMSRYQDKMVILLRCLAASGTGAALRIAAALAAGYGPPVFKEESAAPDATVFYLLDQTFNTASTKNKKGMDPATLAEDILKCRAKNDRLRGSPDHRPFKNYEVHYVTSTRDNEETSLRMMIDKAYELMDKRADDCVQKYGNADAAKHDLYVFGLRGSYLYRWERNAWKARSDAATVWSKDVTSLVALNNKVKVMVCGPGRSLDREGDQGVHMTKEIQHKMGDLRANLIPVVSADAVSWGSEVDSYGRNRPVQRAWAVVPPYLAAVPDFFSLTRTTWPGSVTLHIRDNILKLLKEGTSSKMGDGGSMSESEDVDMTGAALGGPPVGVTPGGQSSDAGQQVEGQIAAPKAPPKALVTKGMLASVRPKSPPNPPRSPRVSSPQVTATEVGNRWSSNLRTPRATIEEENAGGSAEVDDLLPDREGVDLPTDTFNDGGDPTEAEEQEFAGDVEMEPEKEAEAPAVGEEETPGREAEVPQATTTTTEPSVESPAAKRAASPVREERRAREPAGDQPGVPISYAPKYTDDDGDLRDTAATPKAASTQESRGGIHNYANTPYPEHPGEAPELKSAEVRHHREHSSYQSTRGSRTSARPAESRSNRRFIVQHVLAREAGEPFIYAVIRNKAITRERVTAEEWRKANETSHIVFPNRDSEWSAVLERAVHNDFMYGALDASRAAGRIDQEYINPRDRKSTPWGDQQWNMKKVASEAAHIPLGMRQDIQAKYHHGRAPPGDWADMPDRDDYMVRGVVSDPNRRMIAFGRRE